VGGGERAGAGERRRGEREEPERRASGSLHSSGGAENISASTGANVSLTSDYTNSSFHPADHIFLDQALVLGNSFIYSLSGLLHSWDSLWHPKVLCLYSLFWEVRTSLLINPASVQAGYSTGLGILKHSCFPWCTQHAKHTVCCVFAAGMNIIPWLVEESCALSLRCTLQNHNRFWMGTYHSHFLRKV